MLATPELQSKLLHRLKLIHEDASPVAVQSPDSPTRFCPEAPEIKAKIQAVLADTDAALTKQRYIESSAVSRSIELASEVARFRVEIEVLKQSLELAQSEAHKHRIDTHFEVKRERAYQESSMRLEQKTTAAESHLQELVVDVDLARAEKLTLEEKVQQLEAELATQVVNHMQFEVLLRQSEGRQAELRKAIDAAEIKFGLNLRPKEDVAAEMTFALNIDDEDSDTSEGNSDDGDLECSYEGLELSRSMTMDQALQLARRGTISGPSSRTASKPASGFKGPRLDLSKIQNLEDTAQELEGNEKQYEAPLQALQSALARLRGSQEMGHVNALQKVVDMLSPRNVKERPLDLSMFDDHVDKLQEVVQSLTPRAAKAAEMTPVRVRVLPALKIDPSSPSTPIPLSGFALFSPYARLGQKYQVGLGR